MEEKKKSIPEKRDIYARMGAIMKATKAVGKNNRNEQQRFNFRGIDDVMNEMHGAFADNGVFIIPEVLDFSRSEVVTSKGGKLLYTMVKVRYHFVAEDGSEIVSTAIGEGMDSGDKSTTKAMSIALKYALLQVFLIPTKEDKDPDAQSYELAANSPATTGAHDPLAADLAQALAELRATTDRTSAQNVWNKWTRKVQSFGQPDSQFYKAIVEHLKKFPQ